MIEDNHTYHWKSQNMLLLEKYKQLESKSKNIDYRNKDMQGQESFPMGAQCKNHWRCMSKSYCNTINHNNISGKGHAACPYLK